MENQEQACYCGSGKAFAACCETVLQGVSHARTPEELMRARYSAHCLRQYAFLVDSTHPEHRDDVNEEEISRWAENVDWTSLEVHSASPGQNDDEGLVSFTARFSVKGTPQEMKEDASFAKKEGQWFYVDGHVHAQEPYRREHPRVGRNEPCPCGSGKKYKKCCDLQNH